MGNKFSSKKILLNFDMYEYCIKEIIVHRDIMKILVRLNKRKLFLEQKIVIFLNVGGIYLILYKKKE